ncbi:uncharacterized protein LOC128228247 isoform X2 [Mya arenaria]|uniref:uncharacterized protein LOC128228247 isoform X2 n=1 Tax=Mya arenaria TaxID=6604 RepID=UPI0022E62604|nr:uncharacterized protein LOC128228247 isoform X2 [Mya arenaria]
MWCLVLLVVELVLKVNSVDICRTIDNTFWEESKQKCLSCGPCSYGTARNVNAKYTGPTGPHGDEQCLPCRKCTNGYYVHKPEYGNIPAACTLCSTDCASRHRYTEETCNTRHNWKCGGCLLGYADESGNTDIPCLKPPNTKIEEVTKFPFKKSTIESVRRSDLAMSAQAKSTMKETPHVGLYFAIVISCLVIMLVISIIVIHRRKTNRHSRARTMPDYSQINSGIETDGPLERRNDNHLNVGQLNEPEGPSLRRLPNIHTSYTRSNIERGRAHLPSSPINNFVKRLCGCTASDCKNCGDLLSSKNVVVTGEMILKISREICHDCINVFKELGVSDADVYNIDNDRTRDPQNIPQSDVIYKCFARWLQIKGVDARLHDLTRALCRSDFHKVNDFISSDMAPHDNYCEINLGAVGPDSQSQ